jgi:excinuclease ABC subunit A
MIVPNGALSLRQGAIAPWAKSGNTSPYYAQTLEALAKHYSVSMTTPWGDLPDNVRHIILYGSGKDAVTFVYDDGMRSYRTKKPFEGVLRNLERRYRETDSQMIRDDLSKFQSAQPCESCQGYRLRPEALAVKIAGKHIGHISALSIAEAGQWFEDLPNHLNEQQTAIAVRILKEINDRLTFLNAVGLGYLTLSRTSGTLSGGESQRIRLASQIGSGLTGVLYVLDEPSIGLHQKDNERLLETLKKLRDLGNTVIVVEHDEDAIRTADYVVDVGPGAGVHGGTIVAARFSQRHYGECELSDRAISFRTHGD